MADDLRQGVVVAADGTTLGYQSIGHGSGLVLVGGALRSGRDYLGLARNLAGSFEVHLLDRRGRGLSGPQGADHSIGVECDDLLAVAAATGSSTVFGHSFGGLVALEATRRSRSFEHVVVYEPGVPIAGSVRLGWLDAYAACLARGDRRGAFAHMVKGAGFAPRVLTIMPHWYVRAILRVAFRGASWRATEPLLEPTLVEHRILASLEAPTAERFAAVEAHVGLLSGTRSPAFATTKPISELASVIPHSEVEQLESLGHLAPEEAPEVVAAAILRHL